MIRTIIRTLIETDSQKIENKYEKRLNKFYGLLIAFKSHGAPNFTKSSRFTQRD